ncbi:MAG TPA: alpha/beta hydrolase [Candidatus Limnocylindrales bacterium]
MPGAVLAYDVRVNATTTEPVLLLIGAPMAAGAFAALAGQFPDRTVVTYDPRGSERSRLADPSAGTTPQEHADDLHRLILALDAGPADMFATSGGAVNALELVARHPRQVRTLVAHEPPALAVLPDRDAALAASVAVHETYLRSGAGPAMAQFIALATLDGPVPADVASRPGPDPAAFGLPTADDGSRDHPLLGRHMISSTHYEPDFDALRAAPTRIVIGVGAESGNTVAGRGAKAVAGRLGTAPVTFPSGHNGFVGGDGHPAGEPEAFAAMLRRVLAGEG